MALTIGVDVGGTKVLGGVVTPDGEVLDTCRRPTPRSDAQDVADVIAEVIRELTAKNEIEAVGIGAAGFIDAARSIVTFAPNLAWRDEPLRAKIEALVDLPVVVENDANAAAWGEFRFGAARDAAHIVMLTVGTGIGGGIVLDGSLYRGAYGMAAEFGHTRAVPDGLPCGCGDNGCLEQYCSGNALVRYAREAARQDPGAASRLLELADGAVEAIEGQHVTQAARAGDAVAVGAFDTVGRWLGRGIADLVFTLDPGCVVLGGGVAEAGALLFDPTIAAYDEVMKARGRRCDAQIRTALLGNGAGLVGAADLARIR